MSEVEQLTIKEQLLQSISEGLDKQNAKGLKNYNQTLDECPVDDYEWNIMQVEELLDSNQYSIKEIKRLSALLKTRDEEITDLKAEVSLLRQTMDHIYSTVGGIT